MMYGWCIDHDSAGSHYAHDSDDNDEDGGDDGDGDGDADADDDDDDDEDGDGNMVMMRLMMMLMMTGECLDSWTSLQQLASRCWPSISADEHDR